MKVYYIVNIPGVNLLWGKVYSMTPESKSTSLLNEILNKIFRIISYFFQCDCVSDSVELTYR